MRYIRKTILGAKDRVFRNEPYSKEYSEERNIYKHEPDTVEEVFRFFSESNERLFTETWYNGFTMPWIFRGEGSISYSLLPTLIRKTNNTESYNLVCESNPNCLIKEATTLYDLNEILTNFITRALTDRDKDLSKHLLEIYKMRYVEFILAEKFSNESNNIRLDVSSLIEFRRFKSKHFDRTLIESLMREYVYVGSDTSRFKFQPLNRRKFIENPYVIPVALARHHGIHSRLIDWTRDPKVALYFSVEDENIQDDAVVWMINLNDYRSTLSEFLDIYDNFPTVGLEYMHLQKGLFLDMKFMEDYYIKGNRWLPLDRYLFSCLSNVSSFEIDNMPRIIQKVVIKSEFRAEIKRRLEANGIGKHHLMPTYDNVARYVNSNLLRSRPRPD